MKMRSIAWDALDIDDGAILLYLTTLPEHAQNLLEEGLTCSDAHRVELTNAPVRVGPRTASVALRFSDVEEQQLACFEVTCNGYRAFGLPAKLIREHARLEPVTVAPELLAPWDLLAIDEASDDMTPSAADDDCAAPQPPFAPCHADGERSAERLRPLIAAPFCTSLLSVRWLDDEDVLQGTVEIFGVPHRVTCVRVVDPEEDANRIQRGTNDPHDRLDGVLARDGKRGETVTLPGLDGRWVIGVDPFRRG